MIVLNLMKSEVVDLVEKGCVAVVYFAHGKNSGDIVSKHKSSNAAQQAARANDAYCVCYLDDLISQ